ncbi:MAG: hypothetical protein E7595_00540 [Ruminococcaceae bacterium]|nr:hypothetical protein [Oscillospiraceae bacterium]
MKNKTIALITAVSITVAALLLTAGLSLLNGAAINEAPIPETDSFPAVPNDEGPVTDDEIFIDGAPEADEPIEDSPVIEDTEKTEEPELPSAEEGPFPDDEIFVDPAPDAEDYVPAVDANGNPIFPPSEECKEILVEGNSLPCYRYDVVVQIYEHATGKLLGQVTVRDDQAWEDINQLHLDIYKNGHRVYDPDDKDAVPVAIPNGKYRIEVYGIWYADSSGCGSLFFAYTYGDNEFIEMWKHGILYTGCAEFIAYTDALIADEIAAIEAGTNTVPTLEEDVTYICGFSGEMVSRTAFKWNGDYHKVHEASRGTPRFPYIETEE